MTDQTITLTLKADASGVVQVVGSTVDGVNKKIAQAGNATDAWKRQLGQLGNVAKAGFAAMVAGAAAVTAGTAALVRQSINTADALQEVSDRTGVAVETLSELSYAATLNATSLQAVEKGLAKLAREADNGGAGLARIGVAAKDADGKIRPVEDLLGDVADAMQDMTSPAEKAAAAQQIFGKAGAELIPLLSGGREGMAAMAAEAERLGVVISGDTAQAAALLNDNLDRLKNAGQGLGNSITEALLPTLVDLSTRAIEYGQSLIAAEKQSGFFQSATEAMGTGLKVALLALVLVKNALDAFLTTVIGAVDIVATSFGAIGRIIGTVATSIRDALAAAFDMDAAGVKAAIGGVGDQVAAILTETTSRIAASGGAVAAAWDESVGDVTNSIDALFGKYEQGAKASKDLATASGQVASANRSLGASSKDAAEAEKTRLEAIRDLEGAMRSLSGITADFERQLAGPIEQAQLDYQERVVAIGTAADTALAALEKLGGTVEQQTEIYETEARAMDLAAQARDRATRAAEVDLATRTQYASVVDAGLASMQAETRQMAMTTQERATEVAMLDAATAAFADYIAGRRTSITLTAEEQAAIRARVATELTVQDQLAASQAAAQEFEGTWTSGIGNVATAFSDWIVGGISSFKDFGRAALDIARQTLADIIAMFLRNKILVSVGGVGAPGLAGAATGQGGLLAGAGNLLGGITQGGGLLGGFLNSTFGAVGGALAGFGGALGSFGAGMTVAGNAGLLAAGQFGAAQIAAGNLAVGFGALLPAIGAVVAAVALINTVSGGRLLGTSYRPESATSTLAIGADGGDASQTIREVRQRSLFRGRQWRNRDVDASDEATQAAEQLFDAVRNVMVQAARQLEGDAPDMIAAALRTVQQFDKDGKVKATQYFVDVLGRTWEEATAEAAAQRISAEALIATIDNILGTTVDAAIATTASAGEAAANGAADAVGSASAGIFDTIVRKAGDAQGEATAIAERWRDDAAVLMDGAQMLLAAATDIRAGSGLLGEAGTLTQITDLVEDLATEGESLAAAYNRIATSTRLLEQALDLSGVSLEATREELVRFATDITTAAGGLERAQALWSAYFETFYTAGERAAYQLSQARQAADSQAADIGLNAADFTGSGGAAAFRQLFESQLPTLSAEAVVEWLEFAAALGVVIDLSGQAGAAVEGYGNTLAELMAGVQTQLDELAPPATFADRLAQITTETDQLITRATALGATETQLAQIRELGAARIGEVLAEQAEAQLRYADIVRSVGDQLDDARGLSEFGRDMREINRDLAATIAAMNEAARAAGMQGAAETDLAAAHELAAIRAAAAIARLQERGRSLVDQLYGATTGMANAAAAMEDHWNGIYGFGEGMGAGMDRVTDATNEAISAQISAQQRIKDWLDNLLIGDLGGLRPRDAMAEAQALFDRTLTAAQGGDADAMAALPQLADQLLRLGQRVYASGEPYFAMRDAIRDALEALTGPAGTPGTNSQPINNESQASLSGPFGGNFFGDPVRTGADPRAQMEREAAERRAMATELASVIRDLVIATGDPLDEIALGLGLSMASLVTDLGVNLDALTVATATQLGDIAQSTGTELSALAASVGVDLGSLADQQSLMNDALEAEIAALPPEQAARLSPMLDAIEAAAILGDNAGVEAGITDMETAINGMSPAVRDALAPYFEGVIAAASSTTQLAVLGDLAGETRAQTGILAAILGAIGSLADAGGGDEGGGGFGPGGTFGGGVGPIRPPGYAVGTGYVPTDGLAYLHRGEAVFPASVADFFRREGIPIQPAPVLGGPSGGQSGAGSDALIAELRELRRERRDADEYTKRLEARLFQLETATRDAASRQAAATDRQTDAIKQGRR